MHNLHEAAVYVISFIVLIGVMGLWLATGAKTTFFPASASWTLYLGGGSHQGSAALHRTGSCRTHT